MRGIQMLELITMTTLEKFIKAIEEGKYPRYLYKFRKFDEFTDSIFINNSLWFADSESFNDPFDCSLSETRNHKISELREYLGIFGESPSYSKAIISKAKKDSNLIRDLAIKTRKDTLKKYGILSLSKSHKNILMWSHYAENHTGFVIEFDLLKDPNYFKSLIKVTYQDSYEELNYYKNREEAVIKNISTKSSLWYYEEEIRLIEKGVGLRNFKRESISKIYFGIRSDTAKVDKLKSLVSHEGYNVKYYIAGIKHGKFELNFIKV